MRLYSYYTTFLMLLLTIVILYFIAMNSSNGQEVDSNVSTTVKENIDYNASQVLQAFISHSFPIEDTYYCDIAEDVSFDNTTRSECTSKVKFTDSRYTDHSTASGNIEVFVSTEAAIRRKESLDASYGDSRYIFINHNILLTLSKKLCEPYIKEYRVFFSSIYSLSPDSFNETATNDLNSVSDTTENTKKFSFPVIDFDINSKSEAKQDSSKKIYPVGDDLIAGEYLLLGEADYCYFIVYQDNSLSTSSIVCSETFTNSTILTVSDGQYLLLKNCIAVPIDKANAFTTSFNGMYKVGTTLPGGVYTLTSEPGSQGYYEIASDSLHTIDSIISNDNFTGTVQITIQSGQYLTIKNAHIKKTA